MAVSLRPRPGVPALLQRARASLRFRARRFLGVDSLESVLNGSATELRLRVEELHRIVDELHRLIREGHARLDELARKDELRSESDRLRERIAALVDAIQGSQGAAGNREDGNTHPSPGPTQPSASPGVTALAQAFYPAFEREFRGTYEQILDRQRVYRERLENLPDGKVADLGCGRGEWLALLREWGIEAVGVDDNALNVSTLQESGFDAVRDDALAWLRRQPDASLAAVTAFHLVEHLSFDVLLALLEDARRVLAPGGLLLLETPNPENVLVATQSFWLDPTHRKPIPPQLLEFAVSWSGFRCEAVLRLHPPEDDKSAQPDPTLRALVSSGRDYAVIARRPDARNVG